MPEEQTPRDDEFAWTLRAERDRRMLVDAWCALAAHCGLEIYPGGTDSL